MSERKVSVRLGVTGGKEVEATFERVGAKGSAAMTRLGQAGEQATRETTRASRRLGGQVQNASYQVTDFVVQVQGGTSVMRAMGQQLPQLLGGFGMFGAAAGLAAVLAVPFFNMLFAGPDRLKEFDEALERSTAKIKAFKDSTQNFTLEGLDALIEKYGALDKTMAHILEMEAQLNKEESGKEQALTRTALVERIGESDVGMVVDQVRFLVTQMKVAGLEAETFNEIMAEISAESGISLEALKELAAIDLSASEEDAVKAMDRFLFLTKDSKVMTNELRQAIIETSKASAELANANNSPITWIDMAAQQALKLANTIWDAVKAKRALDIANAPALAVERARQVAPYAGLPSLVDQAAGPSSTEELAIYNAWKARNQRIKDEQEREAGRSGAGAGGGKATNDLEREAQQIYEATRTAAEKYATEIGRLNELKKAGLIDGDTYNRQVQALGIEYGQQVNVLDVVADKLKKFSEDTKDIAGQIGDALVDAFEAGGDAVADFVKTGKLDFRGLITDMLAQEARLASMKYIFGPIGNMLGRALGRISGQGILGSVLHGGGMGSAGGTRALPALAWANAPRLHGGGQMGLSANETAAIILKNERVLSPAETRAYNRGNRAPDIHFHVKDAQSLRQSRTQIASDAQRALRAAGRGS